MPSFGRMTRRCGTRLAESRGWKLRSRLAASLTMLLLPACADPLVAPLHQQDPELPVPSPGKAEGSPWTVVNDDGGWCWFDGPRAIVSGDRLLVGTVASGVRDPKRRGDVEATVYDLSTNQGWIIELHDQLLLDDHASPGLLLRPDGSYLAVYAAHNDENRFYYRVSKPNDPTSWSRERSFAPSDTTRVTYSNVFQLPMENGRVYDFFRGLDADPKPSYVFSDDLGATWERGNLVVHVPDAHNQRPYARYVSNDVDTIHVVYTEGHPRNYDNSLYHVYYRSGTLHATDGKAIAPLSVGLDRPEDGTRIFQG
ncbi:MAG: BNR-4 repeat-containing protein, partial [Polyangiaceae bacterium]|nr:BNR-4 repeat-containing protein [Polyangiaceae bacterium]